jgi:hypothetical protein
MVHFAVTLFVLTLARATYNSDRPEFVCESFELLVVCILGIKGGACPCIPATEEVSV